MRIFKSLLSFFSQFKRDGITVANIKDSAITIYRNVTLMARPKFKVTNKWFNSLLKISYDDEIKFKYIPELHQVNDFEKNQLTDILDFERWKGYYVNQISICEEYIQRFITSNNNFIQSLEAEKIVIIDNEHIYLKKVANLLADIAQLKAKLDEYKNIFNLEGYASLSNKEKLIKIEHRIDGVISFSARDWISFLNKALQDSSVLRYLFQHFNQVYTNISDLNRMLDNFRMLSSSKIIAGNAGTGKTHIAAHIINTVNGNGDYVLFFKPKQFSGDDVNLEERLLQLLKVPSGYTLNEVLQSLNSFAKKNKKRCFIIIEALNETTRSSIGFSTIWNNYLQDFIGHVSSFSYLYVICTLRYSYVEHIWVTRPKTLVQIEGFKKFVDVKSACEKYFNYYYIKVNNIQEADLSIFKVPLLLDLYCRFINDDRAKVKEINLDMNTYLQIFEDYIIKLTREVRSGLNLQKDKLIKEGFNITSKAFFLNNEAVISTEDFNDAFDKDDAISFSNSIARSVLEGYLIFIKEQIVRNKEIVKHTQQEVGGYLLAKGLLEEYSTIDNLLSSQEFNEKVLGSDATKHHQLRLDILKFLIALSPDLIAKLNSVESLRLSWWYVYNTSAPQHKEKISNHLLSYTNNSELNNYVLSSSFNYWFKLDNEFNFNFIANYLQRLDLWLFDISWSFFLYDDAAYFIELLNDNIHEVRKNGFELKNAEYYILFAKFCAFATASTVHEICDLATIYLIEFGKAYPMQLLHLSNYCLSLPDSLIYSKLVSCCYGVAMILQNGNEFIMLHLPEMARVLFQQHFYSSSDASTFNYLAIDSIKHLVDLAIHKGAIILNEDELLSLHDYQFVLPNTWIEPSVDDNRKIANSDGMHWPEPIGMDFAIYTIPRLIDSDTGIRSEAISNVFKRVYELGYIVSDSADLSDDRFSDFYWGRKILNSDGKVDRLGKKYSWRAFYDYAGLLLKQKRLNVFEGYTGEGYYQRLSDVDIDISLPNKQYIECKRLYDQSLINTDKINWYEEVLIDSIVPLFNYSFDDEQHLMLYGKVDERIDEEYNTRSFIIVESFFIKKNEEFDKLKASVLDKHFGWESDVNFPKDNLNNVYFGELYWADNIAVLADEYVSIPTGGTETFEIELDMSDIIIRDGYTFDDIGKKVELFQNESIHFESEPTLLEYSWETDSKIVNGFREYFPAVKMGKALGLKVEPSTGNILDPNLKSCYRCIKFEEAFFQNDFNYIRSDLIEKYMSENNLALIYQIKQHSYISGSNNNRSMKFFVAE